MTQSHTFALHVAGTQLPVRLLQENQPYTVHDATLAHRIERVLRLKKNERVTLFDKKSYSDALFQAIKGTKEVQLLLETISPIQEPSPAIDIIMPLLKRDALQAALYSCVELGVTNIYLVTTAKAHTVSHVSDIDRLFAIMIAAAEQSKQFLLPKLHAHTSLADHVSSSLYLNENRCYFDPQGKPLIECITTLQTKKNRGMTLSFGPEGDFTEQEKTLLKSAGFQPYALTKTVLRAQQALVVGLGALRSMLE